jgi:hypothetical protein
VKLRDASDVVADLAADIFTIEVNTILKEDITAQKMPPICHALIDICRQYDHALAALPPLPGLPYQRLPREEHKTAVEVHWSPGAGLRSLDHLRAWADRLHRHGHLQERQQRMVASRVRANCDILKGVLLRAGFRQDTSLRRDRLQLVCDGDSSSLNRKEDWLSTGDITLDRRDRIALRKIWDMGLEEVVVQTLVHLDGDVVTRVHPDFVHDLQVLQQHDQNLKVAIGFWQQLVSTIATLGREAALWARSR